MHSFNMYILCLLAWKHLSTLFTVEKAFSNITTRTNSIVISFWIGRTSIIQTHLVGVHSDIWKQHKVKSKLSSFYSNNLKLCKRSIPCMSNSTTLMNASHQTWKLNVGAIEMFQTAQAQHYRSSFKELGRSATNTDGSPGKFYKVWQNKAQLFWCRLKALGYLYTLPQIHGRVTFSCTASTWSFLFCCPVKVFPQISHCHIALELPSGPWELDRSYITEWAPLSPGICGMKSFPYPIWDSGWLLPEKCLDSVPKSEINKKSHLVPVLITRYGIVVLE